MKIIYIHQYFKTPQEGGAIRSYYISKSFIKAGHEVEMITSHNSRHLVNKNIEGINVHYLPVTYDNKFGFFRRVVSFLKFIFVAAHYSSKINADICYATSTPLTVGAVALWLKWKKKFPYYFEVRDLWPGAPVKLGILKNKLLIYLAYRFEKLIYHKAEKIICLSPAIENDIKKRYLYLNTIRIPNISDCSFFNLEEKNQNLLKKFDVNDSQFVISYFGAIGKVNQLQYLIDAAKICQEKSSKIKFFIAGKGGEERKIRHLAKELNLKNVCFLGHIDKYKLRKLLNVTDAAYISFLKNPILESNSPNKFFDALAAGKLVITNTRGWVKDLVDEHECGFYANPELPEEFYQKILPYLNDRQLLNMSKENSRKLAEKSFSREILTNKLLSEILPARIKSNQSIGL